MKNKLISLLLVTSVLVFISFVSGASGASSDNVTIVIPAVSGTMTGTASFNCSLQAGYEAENWTRVRASLQSASLTANTTETAFTSFVLNNTAFQFNGTIVSSIVEDGTDYTFKCQLWNGTKYINQTRSSITINNTVPTAPTSLTPTSDTDNSVTFSGTVVGRETTACTLKFVGTNYNGASQTMTHTGSTCSLSLTGVPESSYKWYITASDGTDTTDSSQQTTTVDVKTSAGKAGLLASQQGVQSAGGSKLLVTTGTNEGFLGGNGTTIIIVVVLVALVVFALIRRK